VSLVVDLFAGAGGASLGIRDALGRDPDVAINHDPVAVSVHAANHPATRHLRGNVWAYAPRDVTQGAPVDLLHASPTCTHFSKAKGAPLDRREATKVRALAWVVNRWAHEARPRIITLENVEAFADWGPLLNDGRPCPVRKGLTFRRWVKSLRDAGYAVEWRELRACDYGAPTSRKRLFVIARCDGRPIVWPTPTHGRGLLPYRTAAECIDWSIPCPSIFDRKKPLSEATMRRIARGLRRFVLETDRPFVVAGGVKHGLVTAFLAKHFGGHEGPGQALTLPLGTVTCRDHHALVTATAHGDRDRREQVRAFLIRYNGDAIGQPAQLPLQTITTARRFGLVTVHGEAYEIADIGMRLLAPRELARAQGFPDDFVLDRGVDGEPISKTAQIRLIGNSVAKHVAEAIVRANVVGREVVAA